MLHDKHAGPEEVDEVVALVELLHMHLEAHDAVALYSEDLEELQPEALGLRVLIVGMGPLLGEGGGAAADLDAREGHGGKVARAGLALACGISLAADRSNFMQRMWLSTCVGRTTFSS